MTNGSNDTPQEQAGGPNAVFSPDVPQLLRTHFAHLQRSGLSLDVIKERGYLEFW